MDAQRLWLVTATMCAAGDVQAKLQAREIYVHSEIESGRGAARVSLPHQDLQSW